MAVMQEQQEGSGFDLLLGLILGLLGGTLAGILFAPKPGKAFQEDIQSLFNNFPEVLDDGLTQSKRQYRELVGKTKENIENQLTQRSQRKKAMRMAEAKRREELETGTYEY